MLQSDLELLKRLAATPAGREFRDILQRRLNEEHNNVPLIPRDNLVEYQAKVRVLSELIRFLTI